jgi:serine/threonine-protein kinase
MAAAGSARALFEAALALDTAQREAFLTSACGEDALLQQRVRRLLEFDQAPAESAPSPEPPFAAEPQREIGGWRLGECLGRGGMGEVWAAERGQGPLLQRAALKRVEIGDDPLRARRFMTECQALLRLRHPHIVGLIDAGQDGASHAFAVMERVEGQNLLRHAELHRLDLRARLLLFGQLCAAVAAAHVALLIHRDLKPGNVLVDAQGQVRLLDFGIARALDLYPGDRTQTAERAFTPEYAAPEQYRGGPDSAATDVHALGVMLYELITGQRPRSLAGLGPAEALARLEGPLPRPPSQCLDETSLTTLPNRGRADRDLLRDLDAICLKALRPEPAQRYASAQMLLTDLQRSLSGVPVEARRDQRGYRWRRWLRRHRRPLAVACAGLILMIGSAGWIDHSRRAAQSEHDRSERLARVLSQTIETADPRSGVGLGAAAPALLTDSARRIDEDLSAEPSLRGELKRVVGESLLALGMYRPAATQLTEASELLAADAQNRASWLQAMEAQGRALALSGQTEQAEKIYALAMASEPDEGTRLRLRLGQLGLAVERGQYGPALDALPQVRAGLRESLGEGHLAHLRALTLEVQALVSLSFLEQAQQRNDELARLQARHLPPRHPAHASTVWRQSDLARRLGQGERALALAELTVTRFAEIYGENSAAMVSALTIRANAEQSANRPAAAVASTQAALVLAERHYEPAEPVRAMLHFNLAGLLSDGLGRHSAAEPHFRSAIELAVAGGRQDHPTRGLFSFAYARWLNDRGRYAEALEQVVAAGACFAPDNMLQTDLQVEQAIADAALGRPQAAARSLAHALSRLREVRPEDDTSVLRADALALALAADASTSTHSLGTYPNAHSDAR